MERSPILIESGTKYFLQETLKQCNKVRTYYYSFLLNIFILFIFLLALGGFLYYRYSSRLTPEQKKKKHQKEQEYILTKLRSINEEAQRKQNLFITNLPRYENHFEKMHKNYYKV